MEVLFAIPLIIVPFFWPVLTGLMAKNFGRKFWVWFWLGVPLPFIGVVILLFLPEKIKKKGELKAVENDKIFDHLFIDAKELRIDKNDIHLSASA